MTTLVPRIPTPLDYITKLKLFLIALHREGQILCRFYLSGMMNWAAELFLLHFNFSTLIPSRSTWKLSSRIFFDSALFIAEWQVLKMKNFFNKNSSLHLWIWISKCFRFRREKVASDLDDGLLITELELQINFHSQNFATDERESGEFPRDVFPTHEIEYGGFSLSPAWLKRWQRDAISVERIQIGKLFREEFLIRTIIISWRAQHSHADFYIILIAHITSTCLSRNCLPISLIWSRVGCWNAYLASHELHWVNKLKLIEKQQESETIKQICIFFNAVTRAFAF